LITIINNSGIHAELKLTSIVDKHGVCACVCVCGTIVLREKQHLE